MKKIIIAMIALSAMVAVEAQNQERGFHVGDTVFVPRSAEYFLTGEHIAPWVFDEAQVIQKVGGRRFPEGVLLQPVNSWFTKESLLWEPEPEPQPEPQPEPEPQPVVEPEPVVVKVPVVEPEPAPVVEPEPAPVVEPEPVVEPAPKRDQHRLGFGLRTGLSSFIQDMNTQYAIQNARQRLGFVGMLDIEYAWMRRLNSNNAICLGIRTGVSLGLASSGITADEITDSYIVTDNEKNPLLDGAPNNIYYTVNAKNIRERQAQFMVEVPLLFDLHHDCGLVFAIGPKINLPILGYYQTTYTDPSINAHYIEMGIDELNQQVTGKLDGVAPQRSKKFFTTTYNLLVYAEIGYEWKFRNGDAFSLTAFSDAPLFSSIMRVNQGSTHFIEVNAPKAGGPDIYTNSISDSYGSAMSYVDFGIKVAYYINFIK